MARRTGAWRRGVNAVATPARTLDRALAAVRAGGWPLLSRTAGPCALLVVAIGFVVSFLVPRLTGGREGAGAAAQTGEAGLALLAAFVVAGPLATLGLTSLTRVGASVVSDVPLSERAGPWALARLTAGLLARVLGLAGIGAVVLLLAGAATDGGGDGFAGAGLITVGVILLLTAGGYALYLMTEYAFAFTASSVEGLGPADACRRSRALMAAGGRATNGVSFLWTLYGAIFGLFLVFGMGLGTVLELVGVSDGFAGTLPLATLIDAVFSAAMDFLILWPVLTFGTVAVAQGYFDRRSALEGYDVERLAREARLARRVLD